MIRLSVVLFLAISFPLQCIALGFNSRSLGLIFLGATVLSVILFFITARKVFIRGHQAQRLEPDHPFSSVMQKIIFRKGVEKSEYRVWLIPLSEPGVLVWAAGRHSMDLFFTRGSLVSVTEAQLEAFVVSVRNDFHIAEQNHLQALGLILEWLKGSSERFRYWIVSFCVYPLEQALKIAKI